MLSQQIWDNGAACIGIASVFYAAAAGLVRPLNPSIPVLEIVAVRSALSLVFSRIAFLAQEPSASFFGQRKNMGFLAMRGLVGASAMVRAVICQPLNDRPCNNVFIKYVFCIMRYARASHSLYCVIRV
jgi:hypothetical protein